MHVLATNQKNVYKAFYVGKSQDFGQRWYDHLFQLFLNPNVQVFVPKSADEFLENPVKVFNEKALCQNLPKRKETQRKILRETWFCFAEIHCFNRWDSLEHIEYVLQEAVKKYLEITVQGYIGDIGNRPKPKSNIAIHNHFYREFLRGILPQKILYKQEDGTIEFVE